MRCRSVTRRTANESLRSQASRLSLVDKANGRHLVRRSVSHWWCPFVFRTVSVALMRGNKVSRFHGSCTLASALFHCVPDNSYRVSALPLFLIFLFSFLFSLFSFFFPPSYKP